jgi:hypothetical protein
MGLGELPHNIENISISPPCPTSSCRTVTSLSTAIDDVYGQAKFVRVERGVKRFET